jgi:CRP/FNR family transcriptional regulator
MDRVVAVPSLSVLADGHPCRGCSARALAVCGVLDLDDLAALRCRGGTVVVPAGRALFHQGDPATQVFNLTAGMLRLTKLLPDGRRQVLGFRFAGDFIGVGQGKTQTFTAEALSQATLCRFPAARFDEFGEAHPALERALYRKAVHELDAAQQQLLLLGRMTAAERLASFLLDLARRQNGGKGGPPHFVDLPMSRADIADYLGLTKETISRLLAQFRAQRLLRLETLNRVELLDHHALTELAEGEAEALAA